MTDDAATGDSTDPVDETEGSAEPSPESRGHSEDASGASPTGDTAAGEDEAEESVIPDPSDGLSDPRENVPTPEAPAVSVPEVGTDSPEVPSPEDAPDELKAEFWELVIAFNVAVFALALGGMLIGFNGDFALGGASVGVGLLALVYGIHGYRTREHTP